MGPNSGPNAGTSDSNASDDGYDQHIEPWQPQATREASDNEWQQVTYKKQPKVLPKVPARVPTKPPPRLPMNPPVRLPVNPASRPVNRYAMKSPAKPPVRLLQGSKAPPPRRLPVPPSSGSRAPLLLPSRKARMVLFSNKNDNPARAAFRAQKPHTNEFELSKDCYDIEPEREKLYDILEEMGVRIGSFIRPPQRAKDRKLLLWGTEEQTLETIGELQHWVSQSNAVASHTTKHGVAFAKTGQLSQDKKDKLDKEIKLLAMKLKYQKAPDPNLSFAHIGFFLWPVDEIRPDDLLGPSYEAFDPIRMDYHSYILFDDQLSSFKILGSEKGSVERAMRRIKGTMIEFVARNNREITVHMVERPQARLMRENVKMKEGKDEHAIIPVLAGTYLTSQKRAEWDRERKRVEDHQFAQWRQTIDKALKRLRYYRGHVRMRVLLGTFQLTTFRRLPKGTDSITFQKFVEDMDLTSTSGRMKRE